QPTIFGLANNPTTAVAKGATSIVGQFTPPSSDGSWSDQGTLVVTAVQALCAALPAQWQTPTIALSGSSNSNPAVSWSGSLAFPTTNCGSAAPPAQEITLTNNTNQPYSVSATLHFGTYYSVTTSADGGSSTGDAGTGVLPRSGIAKVVVTPKTVTPGAGVLPGSAPYADDLFVSVST